MTDDAREAFLASVEKTYGRQLRRFLAARLRNAAADTPDLMQEIYLRLLRIEDYETIRHPQAYLHTIASHVLQQHALKQAGMAELAATAQVDLDLGSALSLDPANEVEAEQAFESVERSLRALSPRAYTTLVLSRCHGWPLEKIGESLGVSRAQVKKYLARALMHVRDHLHEINEDTP